MKKSKASPSIMKGAEPIFYKGGETGVLLLHGFTSSPYDMKYLAKYLADRNYTVYCPLISGHGTTPEDLDSTEIKHWLRSVKDGYKLLKQFSTTIYVAGSSTGSNLGLMALSKAADVKGFITLGMPMKFRGILDRLFRFFEPIFPFAVPLLVKVKRFYHKEYPKKARRITSKKVHYVDFPIKKILDISTIMKKTSRLLPKVKKPVLVMETIGDHLLDKENGPLILKLLGSRKKRMVTIPDSYHVFIIDKHKQKAFKEIERFIKSNSAS